MDFEALTARGVTIIDTSRDMTLTVAELVLAMTLNLVCDIPPAMALVREGGWKVPVWETRELTQHDSGKT